MTGSLTKDQTPSEFTRELEIGLINQKTSGFLVRYVWEPKTPFKPVPKLERTPEKVYHRDD